MSYYVLKAAERGHLSHLRLMMHGHSASDGVACDTRGRSVLHVAVYAGRVRVVRFLLRACRASPNMRDAEGATPLDVAAHALREERAAWHALSLPDVVERARLEAPAPAPASCGRERGDADDADELCETDATCDLLAVLAELLRAGAVLSGDAKHCPGMPRAHLETPLAASPEHESKAPTPTEPHAIDSGAYVYSAQQRLEAAQAENAALRQALLDAQSGAAKREAALREQLETARQSTAKAGRRTRAALEAREVMALRVESLESQLEALRTHGMHAARERATAQLAHLIETLDCPIERAPMADAVVAPCGHSFGDKALRQWLARRTTAAPECPQCKQPLLVGALSPNFVVRDAVDAMRACATPEADLLDAAMREAEARRAAAAPAPTSQSCAAKPRARVQRRARSGQRRGAVRFS